MEQVERTLRIGDHVKYVDHVGVTHDALVTQDWPGMNGMLPGCNLVYVVSDEDKRDPYGRQIERDTSVNHRSVQPAPGNFWYWPDEER